MGLDSLSESAGNGILHSLMQLYAVNNQSDARRVDLVSNRPLQLCFAITIMGETLGVLQAIGADHYMCSPVGRIAEGKRYE